MEITRANWGVGVSICLGGGRSGTYPHWFEAFDRITPFRGCVAVVSDGAFMELFPAVEFVLLGVLVVVEVVVW